MSVWQPGMTLKDVEKEVIEKALFLYRWNKTMTAQSLGISIKTLSDKIVKYGIADAPKRVAAN